LKPKPRTSGHRRAEQQAWGLRRAIPIRAVWAVSGAEVSCVGPGHGQDLLAEAGQSHPVPELAADQELSLEVSFQSLELWSHRRRGHAGVAAVCGQ